MPAKGPSNLFSRVVAAVRRDPQKAGILTVLFAILLVLQVRLQMSREGAPATATAAATVTPADKDATSDPTGVAGRIDRVAALRAFMDQPAPAVKRNLFLVDLERFPRDGGRATSANPANPSFWDELEKSLTLRADVRRERQILMENLQQQASQLRLQTTVMGASPKAVIDGELVGEGDVVAARSGDGRASFRVLKIEARRIIVEREGIKLAIQMK